MCLESCKYGNLFVSTFIGTPQMNLFDAELVKRNGKYAVVLDGMTVELSEEKQAKLAANNVQEQSVVLGVRPEHITLSDTGVAATVDVHEMMGSSIHLHVTAVGQDEYLAKTAFCDVAKVKANSDTEMWVYTNRHQISGEESKNPENYNCRLF